MIGGKGGIISLFISISGHRRRCGATVAKAKEVDVLFSRSLKAALPGLKSGASTLGVKLHHRSDRAALCKEWIGFALLADGGERAVARNNLDVI